MLRHWVGVLIWLFCLAGCSASTAFYLQGTRALATGDYDRAAQTLSLALVENPQHVGALTALGIAHYRQEAFDAAIDALERAQALAPTDPRISLYLGLSHLRQGQRDQARQQVAAFLEQTRNRVLAEQALRVMAVLEEAALSDPVREYVAHTLEAVVQQEQRLQALREQVHALEAQRQLRTYPLVIRSQKSR
jgi:Flp pilus assembly protein TadD